MAVLKEIPESHYDVLDARCYATVATLMPGGSISNNIVVVLREGREVAFSILKSNQKYRNLKRDPRVGLCILHPDDPWKYVEIRGEVELEDDLDRDFVNAIARKYLDRDEYPFDGPDAERVTCRVHIDSVRAPRLAVGEDKREPKEGRP